MRWLVVLLVVALSCKGGGAGDTDGDAISDSDEGSSALVDTDGDGTPDFEDDDSDADGVPDADEAGDDDVATAPVDTDADGVPDFRDPDSDGDGLSDLAESAAGTVRTEADSDGDGASDLAETVTGTDALDEDDNPTSRGQEVVLVPWMQPAQPETLTLDYRAHIQSADVYFLFDKSGDMEDEIAAARGAVEASLGALTCPDSGVPCVTDAQCDAPGFCGLATGTCRTVPAAPGCAPDLYSGVGQYHDPYNNLRSIQPDSAATQMTIELITAESSISREDLFEAATCVGTGACGTGCTGPVGCPSYREDAVRLLVMFTSENSDAGTLVDATTALQDADITFVGVWSSPLPDDRGDMEDLARSTGSLRADGTTPLVVDGADGAAVAAMDEGIRAALSEVPLRVTVMPEDLVGDDGDALQFIDVVSVNTSGDGPCTSVALTEDTNADGSADTFPALMPGASVCWDVVSAMNDSVEPTAMPQVFRARLTARGDGSPLDQRELVFVVPPVIEIGQ